MQFRGLGNLVSICTMGMDRIVFACLNTNVLNYNKCCFYRACLDPQSNSYDRQDPLQRQFRYIRAVQFLDGFASRGILALLTKSLTIGGSSAAETIPHRLHFRTFPGDNLCFRKVSHMAALGARSRYCAPGGRMVESPSQAVSKNITAGMSKGDCGPMRFPVTV